MLGAEGQHEALASDGFGAQEEGGEIIAACGLRRGIGGLLFFDGAVVVYEDEGVFILRVGIALSALIARAQVALLFVQHMSARDFRDAPKQGERE